MSERTEFPITPPELAEIIKTYFDLGELADLSFRLGVAHEEIKGETKSEKVRELVGYMERRGHLERLTSMVWQLRPHIGINLGRVLTETFSSDDPRLKSVRSLLDQLRQNSEKLIEWKNLHNHLDTIINVSSQFFALVKRLADEGKPVQDIDMLNVSWHPVRREVTKLLQWAEGDIKHIGKRYGVAEDGIRTGEKWAVTLSEQLEVIGILLVECPSQTYRESSREVLRRFTSFMNNQTANHDEWRGWWKNLRENTTAFDKDLRDFMFLADKELRKTARELHDFSKETLWG